MFSETLYPRWAFFSRFSLLSSLVRLSSLRRRLSEFLDIFDGFDDFVSYWKRISIITVIILLSSKRRRAP
jgi:hypothetical protein